MLSHDCVIKFFGRRRSGLTEYLFLEYASGGELFDRIGNTMPHCLSFSLVLVSIVVLNALIKAIKVQSWNVNCIEEANHAEVDLVFIEAKLHRN